MCIDDDPFLPTGPGKVAKWESKASSLSFAHCSHRVAESWVTRDGRSAARLRVELRDAKEPTGNIVMTPWKMMHKHPDIGCGRLLPLASLSVGPNSFLFSGDSCLAATSCLGCLQCVCLLTPETVVFLCDTSQTWGQSTTSKWRSSTTSSMHCAGSCCWQNFWDFAAMSFF